MNSNANPLFNNSSSFNPPFDQPTSFDPSLAMNNGPVGNGSIDPSQFSNLQFGTTRGPSPSFQHPNFQTNPVIPAKRPRPGEDNVNASPRMPNANFGGSRSQTPQQPNFPNNFPGQGGQQHFPQANQWQHLQQTSQASPSPVMQNQSFRGPQRGQTNSPAQFPGPSQPDASNMNRLGTPSNPLMGGPMRGMPFGQNHMQMPGQPGMPFPNNQPNHQSSNSLDMQRQYQQRLQQAQQALQQRQNTASMDPSARAAMMGKMNGAQQPQQPMPGMNSQQQQSAQSQQRAMQQAQAFMKNYFAFAQKQGIQISQNLHISGRPMNHYQLFAHASKAGVLASGPSRANWAHLAQTLGLQDPNAQQELKNVFEAQGLYQFSVSWLKMMRDRQQQQQGQPGMPMPGQPQQSPTPSQGPFGGHSGGTPTSHHGAGLSQPANIHSTPQSRHASIPDQNGVSTPAERHFKSQSPMTSGSPAVRPPSLPHQASEPNLNDVTKSPAKPLTNQRALERAKSPTYKPLAHPQNDKFLGMSISSIARMGYEIESLVTAARANSLGPADIHQLTMTLQSGMSMEMSNALDTLALITQPELSRIPGLQLAECEHLLDALLELAEAELDNLAEACQSSSDTLQIPNFQKLFTKQREETSLLQDRCRAQQSDADLERSAERVLSIVLILRNLATQEDEITANILSDSSIANLLINILRHLATRRRFFRTDNITFNLMKDLVVLLSIVSTRLELSSEEDAEVVLNFLIAFAPSVPSLSASRIDSAIEFRPYSPTEHQYLPYAIETLAKVLARDDPNRTHFKAIFQAEASADPPSSLLLGAFALAIAPIPDRASRHLDGHGERSLVRSRIAFFSMSMLCGDILASLAPSTPFETLANGDQDERAVSSSARNVCDVLLSTSDDWACNLAYYINALAYENVRPVQGPRGELMHGQREFDMITIRGFSMLQRLVAKAYKGSDTFRKLFNMDDLVVLGLSDPKFDIHILHPMLAIVRSTDGPW